MTVHDLSKQLPQGSLAMEVVVSTFNRSTLFSEVGPSFRLCLKRVGELWKNGLNDYKLRLIHGKDWKIVTTFLGLLSLETGTAAGIFEALNFFIQNIFL